MTRIITRAALTALATAALAGAAAAAPLAAANGMTVYTYDKDAGGTSACYDACATNWPPYLVKDGAHMEKDWTKVKRKDGAEQWAYDGKPLYFFALDKAKGDAKGDGKGGVWHVINE